MKPKVVKKSSFWQLKVKLHDCGHHENFLVVNADDFDNFLVDNHKVVLLTTHLKTFRQPCVLCVARAVWMWNTEYTNILPEAFLTFAGKSSVDPSYETNGPYTACIVWNLNNEKNKKTKHAQTLRSPPPTGCA